MDTLQSPELASPSPAIVVDVAALRRAVEAAKPAQQMVMITPEQLETLLLVVDENAQLRRELDAARLGLRSVIGTIDAALAPALDDERSSTLPPPAEDLGNDAGAYTAYEDEQAQRRAGVHFGDGEGGIE